MSLPIVTVDLILPEMTVEERVFMLEGQYSELLRILADAGLLIVRGPNPGEIYPEGAKA